MAHIIDRDPKAIGWLPVLSEMDEFTIFADELTLLADKFAELPYGILALLASGLKDIKSGEEEEIDSSDYILYEKMYYFIAGVLLRKTDKKLYIRAEDVETLEELFGILSSKISLLEGYYAGILDARFIEGEWMYGMTKDQANKILSIMSREKVDEKID